MNSMEKSSSVGNLTPMAFSYTEMKQPPNIRHLRNKAHTVSMQNIPLPKPAESKQNTLDRKVSNDSKKEESSSKVNTLETNTKGSSKLKKLKSFVQSFGKKDQSKSADGKQEVSNKIVQSKSADAIYSMKAEVKTFQPEQLEQIINRLYEFEFLKTTEGVFRISGSLEKVNQILKFISEGEEFKTTSYSIHDIAGALKKVLRGTQMFSQNETATKKFLLAGENTGEKETVNALIEAVNALPENYRLALRKLVVLLDEISKSTDTKMTASNLATCVGPNMVKEPENAIELLTHANNCNFATQKLIENYKEIFPK